jgi:hypothetical protein
MNRLTEGVNKTKGAGRWHRTLTLPSDLISMDCTSLFDPNKPNEKKNHRNKAEWSMQHWREI